MKLLASFITLIVVFYFAAIKAEAAQVPQFPTCLNPQGQIKVNYETGTHGIVGSNATFQGKDTVYTLSSDTLMQCFCAPDGKGIQSNWWKVSSLTESEINVLKSQGWNFIPNGALWGLEQAPYLVFNSEYICKAQGQGGGFSPTTDIPGPGGGGGGISGIGGVGEVLGLASTGNIKFLLLTITTSLTALFIGLVIKKRTKIFSK